MDGDMKVRYLGECCVVFTSCYSNENHSNENCFEGGFMNFSF